MRRVVSLLLVLLTVAIAGGAGWDMQYGQKVRALHDRLMAELDKDEALQKLTALQVDAAFETPDRNAAMEELDGLRPPVWKTGAHTALKDALRRWQSEEPVTFPARLGATPDEVMQTVIEPWVEQVMASPQAAQIQAAVKANPGLFGAGTDIRQNFLTTGRDRVNAAFQAMPQYQADRAAAEAAFTPATKVFGLF